MEGEAELVFLGGARAQRIQTLDELQKADIAVVVAVEDGDDALDERVVGELGNLKELGRLQRTALVPVNLAEILVKLLELTLAKVKILELSLLLCQLVTHFSSSILLISNRFKVCLYFSIKKIIIN